MTAQQIARLAVALEGWCSEAKAEAMAALIMETRPKLCVEIGVFGGRSLVAQGLALAAVNECGLIYGIDPWTREAVLEGENDPANDAYWASLDLAGVHERFAVAVSGLGLWRTVRLVAVPAHHAYRAFADRSIDVLHIDGNHSQYTSCRDVDLWLPRVKPGGFVWADDVDWPTTQRAVAMLGGACERVKDIGNCRLYRKPCAL